MKKFLEKRSKVLLTSIGINIIYFIYLSILYLTGRKSGTLEEQNLYMFLYYIATLPSYIALAITVVVSTLGITFKVTWLHILALITGAASVVLNPVYAIMGLPIYMCNIVGFTNQIRLNKKIKNKEKIEKTKTKDLEIIYIILIVVTVIFAILLATLGIDILEHLRVLVFERILNV